jgi:signal transduction histidine kinase
MMAKVLPRGLPMPEELWVRRHALVVTVLWSSVACLAVFGLGNGRPAWHVGGDLLLVAGPGVLATMRWPGRTVRTLAASIGTLSASAAAVHLADGAIEAHFAFFVAVPLITLYQSWSVFGLAASYVLLHHGLFGVWQPEAVYNHPAAIAHPWRWAAVHAAFVFAASVASIAAWRVSEQALGALAEQQRREEDLRARRRQALEIHDDIVQGIVVAKLARSLDDPAQLDRALDATLAKARSIVSDLLSDQPESELELVREAHSILAGPLDGPDADDPDDAIGVARGASARRATPVAGAEPRTSSRP